MTVSSTTESRLRGRQPSTAPARAAGRVLGVAPVDESGERRFNTIVHWGYGTGWGAVRGLIAAIGVTGPAATGAHLAAVWGAEQVVLPATEVAEPATQWPAGEVVADLWHHLVYAVATGITYRLLERP